MIKVRLKPNQGIKVGLKTVYLYDETLIEDQVNKAKEWAIKTDGKVQEEGVDIDYSSKYYAGLSKESEQNAKTSELNALESAEEAKRIKDSLGVVYVFRGSVETLYDLPIDAKVGYVYDVLESGTNYAWTGDRWDSLGASFDLSEYAKKEYVDTTEQELQTQITGLSGVLDVEQDKITAIEGKIPTNASSSNLLSTASDLLNVSQGKQDKLTPGENITIENNVISVSGNFVDLTSDQDIGGNKNFTGTLTLNGKDCATWNMPGEYIDLTIGASNTDYVAPANGYFAIGITNSPNGRLYLNRVINNNTIYGTFHTTKYGANDSSGMLIVNKNDIVRIGYDGTVLFFRFIYAKGEK